jgi:hypothetical protein
MVVLVVDAVAAGVPRRAHRKRSRRSGVVIALAAAFARATYFVAWIWHLLRRFNALRSDYEALFPHAAEAVP